MMAKHLLIALLMTAALLETSFAVRCYKCTYPQDRTCLSPSSSTTTEQCSGGFCATLKAEQGGAGAVQRFCQPSMPGMSTGCQLGTCLCNTDFCNNDHVSGAANGNSVERSIVFAAALLVAVFLV